MAKFHPIQWIDVTFNNCKNDWEVTFYRAGKVGRTYKPNWMMLSYLIEILHELKKMNCVDFSVGWCGWVADVRAFTIGEEHKW